MVNRPQTAKGAMDVGDTRRLLLTFPKLKTEQGFVADCLRKAGAPPEALAAW
jgi:hypothetical protein